MIPSNIIIIDNVVKGLNLLELATRPVRRNKCNKCQLTTIKKSIMKNSVKVAKLLGIDICSVGEDMSDRYHIIQ